MKYVALLRGINVGGNRKVEMKKLRELYESLGCTDVTTYLNSGNLLFDRSSPLSLKELGEKMREVFGFEVDTLIKTHQQMKNIANAVPDEWANDETWKTDVAYLFKEIDQKTIVDQLPIKKEFLDIRYVPGALFWHVSRVDYNRSQLNKIVGSKFQKLMTVRNINTARSLGR